MKEWAFAMLSIGGIFVMVSMRDGLNINYLFLGVSLIIISLLMIFKRKKD
ncbi:LPXTG cell wall anchor domain-containing protein [Erysipelothrix urinaevulpis]|nr:LPXTG cell wall anchor domain-containing protein [Erysipelothrix urinaevulpis]